VKVGVIGAAGYAGGELLRLLLSHPKVDEIVAGSESLYACARQVTARSCEPMPSNAAALEPERFASDVRRTARGSR